MSPIRNRISVCLMVALLLAVSGCANQGVTLPPEPVKQQVAQDAADKEKSVLDTYNALLQQKDVTLPEIIKYVDEHIASVSQTGASLMLIGLQKAQKERLSKLPDRFGDSEAVQKALAKSYRNGLTSQAIDSMGNKEAKELLLESQGSGFKIETAEGMYFPVIDYSVYNKYRNTVPLDIATFFDIMTVESDKTPIKDAALVISWNEVIKRAQQQERFIKDYGNSAQIEDMRQLLTRYLTFAMYGANNTPLFSYDSKQMIPAAKKAYLETSFDANKGSFSKAMNEYLTVLKKNDYKLTTEVQEFRNKASKEFR